MALRIDKGFQQHHAVPESFFPIPGQTPLTERENARPQVEEVPVRKNQEAAVVDYQLQAAVVLAQGPTNPAIAHGALQSRARKTQQGRSEEHTSELQSQSNLVCRLLLEKKNKSKPVHD